MLFVKLLKRLLIIIGIRIVHFIAGFAVIKYRIVGYCVRKINHCALGTVIKVLAEAVFKRLHNKRMRKIVITRGNSR